MAAAAHRRVRAAVFALAASSLFAAAAGHAPPGPWAPLPPKAPKEFSATVSGMGGPPIQDTPVGLEGTSTLDLVWLSDYPLAICNDGSQAGYYFAPGSPGVGATTWLVYLEGSMFCWDETSCKQRYVAHDYWMSSTKKPWGTSFAQGGIFATDGTSPWGAVNRVYVKYCTSDMWSGTADASADTFGFWFHGSHVVSAVIDSLINDKGMGSVPGTRLLFGGCSAGAIGAMNNLEAVAAMVPPTVEVRGFLDGAGLLDIAPRGWKWSPWLESLQSLMKNMTEFTQPVFAPYCAENFPGNEWRCLIGQYRMPLLTSVPMFVNLPQFDDFELMYDTDSYMPLSPGQLSFVEEFQAGTLALIGALPPGTGVFSPTCLVHCLSGQTTFTQLQAAGTSLDAALTAWYFEDAPVQAVSSCIGWQCTKQCGVDLTTSLPCNLPSQGCTPITVLQPDPHASTTTDTDMSGFDTAGVPQAMQQAQQAAQQALQQTAAQEASAQGVEEQAEVSALLTASVSSEILQQQEQAAQQAAQAAQQAAQAQQQQQQGRR